MLLEISDFATEACCDKLVLFDGSSTKDPVIVTLSGQLSLASYSSTQQYMYAIFYTDDTSVNSGFNASFTSIPGAG